MSIPTRRVSVPIVDDNNRIIAHMPVTISEQCATCKNWTIALSCRAFPDGIPDEILSGEVDHSKSYPGDSGILYDPIH